MFGQTLISLLAGGLSAGLITFLLREWLSERLKQGIRNEYAQQFEKYKREVELQFNDQVRLRKLYEDLSMSLEDIFGTMSDQNPTQMALVLHKIFALLALYAPDDVYRQVKNTFYSKQGKTVYGKDFRPSVYHALRKSLFGKATELGPEDWVDHLQTTPLPTGTADS